VAIQDTEWEDCVLEAGSNPELERQLKREFGVIPRGVPYFAAVPWYMRAMTEMTRAAFTAVSLTRRIIDQIGLLVSLDNSCRYCFGYQRMMMRAMGVPEAEIRQVEDDLALDDMERWQRRLLDFARSVSRANPLPGPRQRKALIDEGADALMVREAVATAAFMICFNRAATIPALPPQVVEALPDRWFAPLLAPFAKLYLSRVVFTRADPADIPRVPSEGIFASTVEGLQNLPHAAALRRGLDDMQASEGLPERTRALIFAVLARAVGCPVAEAESVAWCLRLGFEQGQVDSALSHLSAPGLDEVESRILPFVRETVWPRPVTIQRKARVLRDELPAGVLAELIATVALANAVVRLGCLGDEAA
jgi:hypothetical protein